MKTAMMPVVLVALVSGASAMELNEPRYDLVLQISSLGHPSQGLVPVTLLNVPQEK